MTAETVISLVVMLIGIAPIIVIGIVQYRSKEPVGFYSGKKPPQKEQLIDVKAYNQKHGLMWIALEVGFIICFVCGLVFGGLIAGYLCMAEIIGGILGMIAYHEKLERRYCKKGSDQ